MSRYWFELATETDDEPLRRVLASTPMDGDVSVSFQREPSYFDAAVVGGDFVQTIVGCLSSTGDIIGFGVRSVRMMFVNGDATPIGYLSTLRLLPEHRNRGLVVRGYRFFAELHQDGRTPLYLTTIAEGNDRAVSVLTGSRAGLPPYHDAGRFFTLVIPPRPGRGWHCWSSEQCGRGSRSTARQAANGGQVGSGTRAAALRRVSVRAASADDLPAIISFLNDHGRSRQFFPQYCPADFFQPRCTFRDLRPDDILLATQGPRIVGTLALWNQMSFRQSVVHGYSRRVRWTRSVYNLSARFRAAPRLPAVGEPLRFCTAAIPVVAGDDPRVCAVLLNAARRRLAEASSRVPGQESRAGLSPLDPGPSTLDPSTPSRHLLLGLHEADPLLPSVKQQAVANYVTRLYYVCWDDGDALRLGLDGRPPYLELGTL